MRSAVADAFARAPRVDTGQTKKELLEVVRQLGGVRSDVKVISDSVASNTSKLDTVRHEVERWRIASDKRAKLVEAKVEQVEVHCRARGRESSSETRRWQKRDEDLSKRIEDTRSEIDRRLGKVVERVAEIAIPSPGRYNPDESTGVRDLIEIRERQARVEAIEAERERTKALVIKICLALAPALAGVAGGLTCWLQK